MPYIYSVLFYSDILIKTAFLKLKKPPENTKTQILFEKEKKMNILAIVLKTYMLHDKCCAIIA